MPFVRGRYHLNPVAGAALEAAREADEALASQPGVENHDGAAISGTPSRAGKASAAKGPIRRVEIVTEEIVPSHSGHGQRGFVARIHRADDTTTSKPEETGLVAASAGNSEPGVDLVSRAKPQPAPETHVFSDPQELTDFLSGEFGKDFQP